MIYRYQMHENSQMECAPLHFVIQTHTKKKSCMSKTGCGFKWGGGGEQNHCKVKGQKMD